MKFIRFGTLAPTWQRQYVAEPTEDTSPHIPPRRNGFYAFPLGYFDPFYLYTPIERPASSPWAITEYLKDENGEKITKKRFEDSKTLVRPYSEAEYLITQKEYFNLALMRESGLSESQKVRKGYLYRKMKDYSKYTKEVFDDSIAKILKKKRVNLKTIDFEPRPSFMMVMKDPDNPPKYIDDDPKKGLDQPLEFLLDDEGNKIWATNFLYKQFDMDNYYDGEFTHIEEDGIKMHEMYVGDKEIPIKKWLTTKGLSFDRLCVWPVYPEGENEYVTIYKKSHMFEYDGCLWHHLGSYLKRNEILDQYGLTWFYTDIKTFERALKKSNPKRFSQVKDYQSKEKNYSMGGLLTYNATFSLEEMYEVFIDHKI